MELQRIPVTKVGQEPGLHESKDVGVAAGVTLATEEPTTGKHRQPNSTSHGSKPPVFRHSYRNASCCSRLFYCYIWKLISSISANDNKMTEDMLEDMTLKDGETEGLVEDFLGHLEKRVALLKAREAETGEAGNYYYPVRNAILATFGAEILRTSGFIFLSECLVIAFTTFLITLIGYLKDPEAEVYLGVVYVAVFAVLMLAASLLRNEQQLLGFKTAIRSRKCLTAALYTKISRLSVRSLAETNSGKLITIVSGDLQAVTPMMGLVAMIFAAPFVNLVAFLVLGYTSGWQNASITIAIWFVILICQHFTAVQTRKFKLAEGKHNDERQKLVNDMFVGGRTIKSYGWENHYLEKIRAARGHQVVFVAK